MPDDVRSTYCDAHSVVMFYQRTIDPDTIAFLNVPIPTNLSEGGREVKRLTVTVCSTPEVQRWGLDRYLATALKWKVFRGDVDPGEVIAAMSVPEEDEIEQPAAAASAPFEEPDAPGQLKFGLGITKRSRGAVQHDVAEWNVHKRVQPQPLHARRRGVQKVEQLRGALAFRRGHPARGHEPKRADL
jgi:hypothetical protein